ncbi:hypothetical protein BHE74_00032048, partial [Ensete ventricosum]
MIGKTKVCGPPATGRFRQISTVGGRSKGEIDRRRSIEREKGKKKKKKKRKKKKKKRKEKKNTYRPCAVVGARTPSRALFSPARGERSRR